MVVKFDPETGNGLHIPTTLYNVAGFIPHPLQNLPIPRLPWYQRATGSIPGNFRSALPGPLANMPAAVHIKKSTVP